MLKKMFLVFLIIANLSFPVLAEGYSKEEIKAKIEKTKESRNKKISETIEKRLNFIEVSDSYKNLPEEAKLQFYQNVVERIRERKQQIKNKNKLEIYNIFERKVEERLEKLYWEKIEEEENILHLIENKNP